MGVKSGGWDQQTQRAKASVVAGRSRRAASSTTDSTTLAAHAGSVRDCRLYRGSNATVQLMCLHHRYPRVCLYV